MYAAVPRITLMPVIIAGVVNAKACCESFRFASVKRTASGTPRLSQIR